MWGPPRDRKPAPGDELDGTDDREGDWHVRDTLILVVAVIGIVVVVAVAVWR